MGYIYVIKNTVNDKLYIGQTRRTITKRFKEHIDFSKKDSVKTKIYVAMRELGIENFYVEQLITCEDTELNKYEQYYVEKYNSLNKGYNSIYPCSSAGKQPVHDYEDKVADMYLSGMSYSYIAKECNISLAEVGRIVHEHNIDTINREYERNKDNKSVEIIMYDNKFINGTYFKSIKLSYKYISTERNRCDFELEFYARVKVACQNGNIAYGHRWQLASDLVYEDKIFRTKFDKEAYIQGKPAYQPEGKQYYIVDGALDLVFKQYRNNTRHQNTCIDCGKEISKHAMRCKACNDKYSATEKAYKNKANHSSKCPDIDTLRNLLSEYNYTQIGKMYNVSGNTVKKWAIRYNLLVEKKEKPSKELLEHLLNISTSALIAAEYGVSQGTVNWWAKQYGIERKHYSKIECIEDNITFDTFRDAAKYMIENNLTTEKSLNHISYHISNVTDTCNNYMGKHWRRI